MSKDGDYTGVSILFLKTLAQISLLHYNNYYEIRVSIHKGSKVTQKMTCLLAIVAFIL